MQTTEQDRGQIQPLRKDRPKPGEIFEAYQIPNLEEQLRQMHGDLNRQTGSDEPFSWNAPWIDAAIGALRLKHQGR